MYLQGIKPMDVFTWLLEFLVVCLESLYGQNSVTLAPHAIVPPGMCKDPVIFKPVSQI